MTENDVAKYAMQLIYDKGSALECGELKDSPVFGGKLAGIAFTVYAEGISELSGKIMYMLNIEHKSEKTK